MQKNINGQQIVHKKIFGEQIVCEECNDQKTKGKKVSEDMDISN